MYEQQGHRIRNVRPLMHKMHIYLCEPFDLHARLVLRQLVQPGLRFAPVEPIPPIRCQTLDVGQGRAIVPSSVGELGGEGGGFELFNGKSALGMVADDRKLGRVTLLRSL